MTWQNPVIVIPGITASKLRDEYPVDPEQVWRILRKDYERVALHPDDLRYESREPARVVADRLFDIPYNELIEELRHDLSPSEDQPTPVYPFAYDWRQPLDVIEKQLESFIAEVIDRTKLMRHYAKAGYSDEGNAKVDLIGHSMGGLIITGYCQRMSMQSASPRVGRVATLGSPFRGSFEAVMKITTGCAALGSAVRPKSREREVARMTPALYHLIPAYEGALRVAPGLPESLFEPDLWQSSVAKTIQQYVRLYGLKRKATRQQAEEILAHLLRSAHTHRERLESFNLDGVELGVDDWLCVVGVDEETRVRLQIENAGGKPCFDLTSEDRLNGWNSENRDEWVNTGDGTVPYAGARCSFIPTEKVVCVSKDDFGYWEDFFTRGPVGLHGMLPKMNLVHRLIASHFSGERRKGTWGRRPPDLPLDADWRPPIEGLAEKS